MELLMLKLGGALITEKDKPFTESKNVIKELARKFMKLGVERILD